MQQLNGRQQECGIPYYRFGQVSERNQGCCYDLTTQPTRALSGHQTMKKVTKFPSTSMRTWRETATQYLNQLLSSLHLSRTTMDFNCHLSRYTPGLLNSYSSSACPPHITYVGASRPNNSIRIWQRNLHMLCHLQTSQFELLRACKK